MKNKNQWMSKFQSLDSKSQLEIASSIVDELYLNEEAIYDDEYDKEKSKIVRDLFNKYIEQAKGKEQLLKLQELLNSFNNLSEIDKQEFIIRMYNATSHYLKEVEQREKNKKIQDKRRAKREFCKINGHNFGDWKEKNWITYEEYNNSEYIFGPASIIEVKHTKWYRSCKHCGSVQTKHTKPIEVETNEIQERIKVLRKELERLENK